MKFEVLPVGDAPHHPDAKKLYWSRNGGSTETIMSSLGWDLKELGVVSPEAADLFRITVASYLADRLCHRPDSFSRSIELVVHVYNRNTWQRNIVNQIADLLSWLTGDSWEIHTIAARTLSRSSRVLELPYAAEEVVLLSGGLDSFCGAVDRMRDGKTRVFVSHSDRTGAVLHAQHFLYNWIRTRATKSPGKISGLLTQVEKKKEPSSRSRSLMFVGLATVSASAVGAKKIIVPENGYTSINPPLNTSRGGALSTRSTHPTTMLRINKLLADLGIDVQVSNPYQPLTKGEFVKLAIEKEINGFLDAAMNTISCGKLDGTFYKGGNPNFNCGLCVPCFVRRGSILNNSVDTTSYLINTLLSSSRNRLIAARYDDISSVQKAALSPLSDTDILSCGPWPDDFDIDSARILCRKALKELSLVPIPL